MSLDMYCHLNESDSDADGEMEEQCVSCLLTSYLGDSPLIRLDVSPSVCKALRTSPHCHFQLLASVGAALAFLMG